MLELSKLSTYHGDIQVLKNINLKVSQGEIVTIIGSNGAGKSTLLGTIAGLYKPSAGNINLNGNVIKGYTADKIVRTGISLVPERREVFDTMNVYENLLLGAYHRYFREKAHIESDIQKTLDLFPALRGKEQQLAGTLSGGEQQMLAIGRALMAKPQLLMLDEPSIGLAPLVVREIFSIIKNLKDMGTTILLVEQNARAALKLADRAYVLERGKILIKGSADDLLNDIRVQSAYLGQLKGA